MLTYVFKNKKSKTTYGIAIIMSFRENIDPESLMFYNHDTPILSHPL